MTLQKKLQGSIKMLNYIFTGLGLDAILKKLNSSNNETALLQIQVFKENLYDDQEALSASDEGLMLVDHYSLFNSLFTKVRYAIWISNFT